MEGTATRCAIGHGAHASLTHLRTMEADAVLIPSACMRATTLMTSYAFWAAAPSRTSLHDLFSLRRACWLNDFNVVLCSDDTLLLVLLLLMLLVLSGLFLK